ncbi:MAG TPA: hypothetical protein VIM70_04220 [Clostridium sp.]|uniref:hypothetical protein n=1 Tax=Clostridium sp. TaxID=1506 RepID=UPI002F95C7C1
MGKNTVESQSRVKRKGVYFNLDDEDELKLFEQADKIKNFSKWVKKHLHNDGVKNYSATERDVEKKIRVKDDIDDMML